VLELAHELSLGPLPDVEGLETDAGKILRYFANDFMGLKETTTLPFTKNSSESTGESGKVARDN
jgi:hypothetical protein